MNDPSHEPDVTTETKVKETRKDTRAPYGAAHESNGNGAKWLAGAAVAALLLGGGYYALKNMPSSTPATEVASVDPAYDTSSATTKSLDASPAASIQAAGTTPDSAASTTTTKTSTTAARRRTVAATTPAPVPEQVIGVSDSGLTADNSDEIVVTPGRRPIWATTPSARRLSALYPERALERGREGEASIHCTVLDGGSLDCVRASEFPTNAGFGNAALRVASRFKHAPQLADGSAAAGTPVNLRVIFRIADNDRRRG